MQPTTGSDDPYELDLPTEWTYTVEDGRVDYVDADETARITISEFSRHLQVYWWVDVYTRSEDGSWTQREVGTGDSFRSGEAAARAAQSVIDATEDGDDLSEAPIIED